MNKSKHEWGDTWFHVKRINKINKVLYYANKYPYYAPLAGHTLKTTAIPKLAEALRYQDSYDYGMRWGVNHTPLTLNTPRIFLKYM